MKKKQLTQNDYEKIRRRKREKSTLFMLCLIVLMELKLISIGRLFQTLTNLSQKKVQRIPVLCGLKLYIYDL